MSNSLEQMKSRSKARPNDGTNGAHPAVPNDSSALEDAPEGIAPVPTLASSKKPNTIALKKRAPVPGRSTAGPATKPNTAPSTVIDTPAQVATEQPIEEYAPEKTPVEDVAPVGSIAAPEAVDAVDAQTGVAEQEKTVQAFGRKFRFEHGRCSNERSDPSCTRHKDRILGYTREIACRVGVATGHCRVWSSAMGTETR